jgi:hypothetical protein
VNRKQVSTNKCCQVLNLSRNLAGTQCAREKVEFPVCLVCWLHCSVSDQNSCSLLRHALPEVAIFVPVSLFSLRNRLLTMCQLGPWGRHLGTRDATVIELKITVEKSHKQLLRMPVLMLWLPH